MRRNVRLIGVILAAAMMLALVVGFVNAQDESVLVLSIDQEMELVSPLNTSTWMEYIESLYNRELWEWDTDRNIFPVMAEAIPSLEDGTIGTTDEGNTWIEVTLREGLMWSDGTPITTADCQATHNIYFDRNTSPNVNGRGLYPDIVTSFEVVDERTFRVTYNQPFPDVVVANERPKCHYPAHILNPPLEAGGQLEDSAYWNMEANESVAFGPFKVVARERNVSWTLVQNEYWPAEFTQPAIDRIVLVLIEDDAQQRNAMRVGDIDVSLNWTEAEVTEYSSMEGVEVWNVASAYADALWIRSGPIVDEPTAARDALQDVRVRHAIIQALDRQFMVDNIVAPGVGVPLSWYPPGFWPADLGYLEYNPDRARELLDEAGWLDHDADEGTTDFPTARQNADGVPLSGLRLTTTQNAIRNSYQLLIQEYLAAVGIRIDVVIVPATVHFALFTQDGTLNAYHFDLAIYASSNEPLTPAVPVDSFGCGYWPTAENPDYGNNSQFCDPRWDELNVLIGQTFPGPERDAMVAEAVTLFTDFAFWNGLRFRPTWFALNTARWDLESFRGMGTLAGNAFNRSEEWRPAS